MSTGPGEKLDAGSRESHGQPRRVPAQNPKCGAAEVGDAVGRDAVPGAAEQSTVSNPDALPLRDEIRPALRTVVDQRRIGDIVQLSSRLSQLSLERGFIDHSVRIKGLDRRTKGNHLAQFRVMACNSVEQHPLEVHDAIDHAARRIRWTRSPSRHAHR